MFCMFSTVATIFVELQLVRIFDFVTRGQIVAIAADSANETELDGGVFLGHKSIRITCIISWGGEKC